MKNTILVMLKTNPSDHIQYKIRFSELKELAQACSYKIVTEVIQTKLNPKSNYLLGRGKIEEIAEMVKELKIKKIIFFNILSSKQKYNISSITDCEDVIDRYDLILEIFDIMSKDQLSKLQIEKARLIKNLPLAKLIASKNLKSEHPGAMGTGDYSYQSKIKGIQTKISKINSEIKKHKKLKESRIKKREKLGMPVICLTGNYNSGKTTLFNHLTGSDKPVSDTPFTTLTSKYQRISNKKLLFVDTIGFVIDIDPKLINSFELNLFDIINANIVLFLVDISDEFEMLKTKFLSGINVLLELKIDYTKIIIVFNKIDKIDESDVITKFKNIKVFFPYQFPYCQISAKESINIDKLIEEINQKLSINKTPD